MDNTEDSVSEDFKEWQQIQHPFPETSPAVRRSGGGWNTTMIRENYLLRGDQSSIFPATTNHEALPIIPKPSSPSASSSSSESFESDEDESPTLSVSDWRLRVAGEGWRLMKLRFEAMRNGVVRVSSRVRNCALCTWAFWSITCVAGAATATVLMVILYAGIQRRRRRDRMQRVDRLNHLLREKDEVSVSPRALEKGICIYIY